MQSPKSPSTKEELIRKIDALKEQLNVSKNNERILRTAQNMAKLGIWEYDLKQNSVTWSEDVYKIYGLDPETVTPSFEDILKYSIPEQKPIIESTIQNAIASGESYQMDCTIIDHHGNKKYVYATGSPHFNDSGELTHLFGTIFDITQRVKEQETLRFSDLTIESISDGIYWFDEEAKFYRVNNAVCEALGYSKEELLGKRGKDINPSFTKKKSNKLWEKTRNEGAISFETNHQRKDGTIFPVEITNNIFEWEGKEFRCSIVRDITERKKREQALVEALKEVEELKNKLEKENTYLREEIRLNHNFDEIISANKKYKKILKKIEQVSDTDTTVLITGESGTGKELLARAIHHLSKRDQSPLVKVNCAALPANLIESELFGHEKGAFTGALSRKVGRFELANNGTIFLDEIGEMPLELQVKLLRVLQENEFERVGGTETIKVDIRVIAATNRDLEEAVAQNKFREDLFYRLNVFPIESLPLRERKDDIPLLVEHFVKKYEKRISKFIKQIPSSTIDQLMAYDWPGNIRELENIIERAMITSKGAKLKVEEGILRKNTSTKTSGIEPLEVMEKQHIERALKVSNGRVSGNSGAAALLKINPKTLESRIVKLGINKKAFIE